MTERHTSPPGVRAYLSGAFGAICVLCVVVGLHLVVESGRAGDLKAGTFGDPLYALYLEGIAAQVLGASVVAGATALLLAKPLPFALRLVCTLVLAPAYMVILWLVAFMLQMQAFPLQQAAQAGLGIVSSG